LLRKAGRPLPWRMWFYPLPCVIAIGGWLYVYVTSDWLYIGMGAATLLVGLAVFLGWADLHRLYMFRWPLFVRTQRLPSGHLPGILHFGPRLHSLPDPE